MAFRAPDLDDLEAIARELGLGMDRAALETMRGFMDPLMHGYQALDGEPDGLPELEYPERRYEYPAAGDNPLNAWYVRTSIEGAADGPLAGRTVAVKDNIFVAGVPLMNGAHVLEGFVPDYDATAVTRLLDAGATIAGKSVCEQLCLSGSSVTASTGFVHNPRKPGYASGGSSSGSAALVGGGHVDMALGCDQAGSIRCPASWSGICGMKPTFGLVPYTGAMGQESCLDHLGPMTADVADNALMLEVLAGYDGYDGRQQRLELLAYTEALGEDVAGMTIGVVAEGFGQPGAEPEVDECVRAAAARFADLGARVVEVSVPRHLAGIAIWGGILGDGLWRTLKLAGLGYDYQGLFSPAQRDFMENWLERLDETSIMVRMLVAMGKYLERYKGRYYVKSKNLAFGLRAAYDAPLAECDLLLMPTAQLRAKALPEDPARATEAQIVGHAMSNLLNTCPLDVTGHPAMSVPCGLRGALPVGMMLIARHFDEPAIYRAAHAFEQSGDWQAM